MKNEWSTYFQNAEFLAASRIATLKSEFAPLVKNWLGLQGGMRVLDVGCGSGEFTRYLGDMVSGCEFVGVDVDDELLKAATEHHSPTNKFEYINADALELPFSKRSFDLVVSHTFFTNISQPLIAMSEMKRVARDGALIASVTPQSLSSIPFHQGVYPPEFTFYPEYMVLWWEIFGLYQSVKPIEQFLVGVQPNMIPQLFVQSGLKEVAMHSTPNSFSLSDTAVPENLKRRYIKLNNIAELKKFHAYMALPEFSCKLSPEKAQRYVELINIRANTLLKNIEENRIFEWYGGSNLIMTGKV